MNQREYMRIKQQMGRLKAAGREAHARKDYAERNRLFSKHDELALSIYQSRSKA